MESLNMAEQRRTSAVQGLRIGEAVLGR